jgi:uncharacterized membrane protein
MGFRYEAFLVKMRFMLCLESTWYDNLYPTGLTFRIAVDKYTFTWRDIMEGKDQSSTGLDENVAGLLCYLLGFITGIVFLVIEKKSNFVKFHAKQSTITFLGLFVISLIIGWIPVIGTLILILSLILWLVLMIKALQGKRYSLPIVGKMAEEKGGQ